MRVNAYIPRVIAQIGAIANRCEKKARRETKVRTKFVDLIWVSHGRAELSRPRAITLTKPHYMIGVVAAVGLLAPGVCVTSPVPLFPITPTYSGSHQSEVVAQQCGKKSLKSLKHMWDRTFHSSHSFESSGCVHTSVRKWFAV